MAASTGPVLALGAIAMINRSVFNGKPADWRVPIATGVLAGMLALVEQASRPLAVGLAYIGLVTVTMTRTDPAVPSPAESFLTWWGSGPGQQQQQ